MNRIALFLGIVFESIFLPVVAQQKLHSGYPIAPVSFTAMHLSPNGFWGERLNSCREVTVPLAFQKCEESNRYQNFILAAQPNVKNKPSQFPFDDTDVYKTIEGASYLLQTFPDQKMKTYIDSVLLLVAAAQEKDGYLNTARTMNPEHPHSWMGPTRWSRVEKLSHEFYNLGHMVEGAVAHYQATGQRNFLDIAIRYADCVCREIGKGEGQHCVVPGHQIAEMALAKLYLVTGDRKYLNQAKFFLDERGKTTIRQAYSQSHQPVTEQKEAVGHAVRAGYMYSGMADIAALTGDTAYIRAVDRIWENIVGNKIYITGGVGATSNGEAFGANYELPNATAYCETCAAIGNVYVNHRLFLLHGEAKYYDVLERTLYNGVLSGVSLRGDKFFYPNPLESSGGYERKAWFGCACCPSNLCRFLPSVPGYAYAVKENQLYVNLYMAGISDLTIGKSKIALQQETAYPFEGNITLRLVKGNGHFGMKLRIPGWSRGEVMPGRLYAFADGLKPEYKVKVNGKEVNGELDKGYLNIDRKWKKGDVVELELDMRPRKIVAHPKVVADRGRLAVQRGPLVYCVEWADNRDVDIFSVLLPEGAEIRVIDEKSPGGALKLAVVMQRLSYNTLGRLQTGEVEVHLIPYYAWANRGQGKMIVWLPTKAGAMHLEQAEKVGSNEFFQ